MPEQENLDAVSLSLEDAIAKMQQIEDRMKSGEEISEDELAEIAKAVAHRVEDALDAMKELVGPEQSADVEKEMIAKMSDEEFKEWSEMYQLREVMRMERKQEKLANLNG